MKTLIAAALIAAASPLAGSPVASQSSPRHDVAATNRDGIVVRASVMPGIAPGTSRPVRLSVSNTGPSVVAIRIVRLVRVAADDAHRNCITKDFTMADVRQDASIPGGTRDKPLEGGTLAYRNTGVNQNACQAATLTLTLVHTRSDGPRRRQA